MRKVYDERVFTKEMDIKSFDRRKRSMVIVSISNMLNVYDDL